MGNKTLFSLFIILCLVTTVGCSQESLGEQFLEAKQVEIITAKQEPITWTAELSGTLQPIEESYVSFELAGKITALHKEEGETVSIGEVLAQLDSQDVRLQHAQARQGVDQAAAGLAEVHNGATPEEINRAKLAVDKARAAYEKALTDYQRIETLYQQEAVAKSDLDLAQTGVTLAEKDLAAAEEAYSQIVQGARSEVKQQVQASYEQARLAENQAALALSKTNLQSPIGGVVIAKLTSVGQLTSPGNPVYRIGNVDELKVILPVPDRDIHEWSVGDLVTLSLYEQTREGRVTKIMPAASQGTGTIGVEVVVPNPDHQWFTGQVVKATKSIKGKTAFFVPVQAVINRGEPEPYLFVLEEGVARKRTVTVGELVDNKLEITSGLSEGEAVIVKGVDRLRDGDAVVQAGGQQP